jgi:hypothetical protein
VSVSERVILIETGIVEAFGGALEDHARASVSYVHELGYRFGRRFGRRLNR